MDKNFNTIIRKGVQLDMYREIENLQDEYNANLQASVEAFDSYDEVANETRNDCVKVEKLLRIYEHLGYLYRDEADDMIQVARELRLNKLKELENERDS